ncbi:hypothetical protein PQR21_23710 [Paraburkholderia nemoris]|uniref:hypothetical protein n=1 Tax=Paraburkholderia nemoris TaxID=2793076 RepID=UPI0038BD994E
MTQTIIQGTSRRFDPEEYDDEDIETGGMGPCLGILIYEPTSKVVYGGHFDGWTHTHVPHEVTNMLDEAFDEFASSASIRVYVSGCCFAQSAADEQQTAKELRTFVSDELAKRNAQNIELKILWPTIEESVNMTLHGTTRTFEMS